MKKYKKRLLTLSLAIIIADLSMYETSFAATSLNNGNTQNQSLVQKTKQSKTITNENKEATLDSDRMQPLNADLGWPNYAELQD